MSEPQRPRFTPATTPAMTFHDRAQWIALRGLLALPTALKRRLAGPPITSGPAPLALDAHLLVRVTARAGFSLVVNESAQASRKALRAGAHALRGTRLPVDAADTTIPNSHGHLTARLYTPSVESTPGALLLFLHGGGWATGDLDVYDYPARFLSHDAGIRVLTVDYRLAPEHPFPAAVEDVVTTFRWIIQHARTLGADPSRVAVGGDSAGANLTATLCNHLAAEPGRKPAFQMLLYPAVDLASVSRSRRQFATGFMLTEHDIDWFANAYAAATPRTDPRLSPRYATPHPALPPTYLATAGYDPLRDEGAAYADALAASGVTVEHAAQDDLVHGYLSFVGLGRRFAQAGSHAAQALKRAMRNPG